MIKIKKQSAIKPRTTEHGISLVELLVGLVVVSLLAIAVFSFFLSSSQGINQQSANGEMWQRGRNALAIMRQAIESAGYGLPNYSQCPNGVVGISSTSATGGALVAITASVQSSGSGYVPPAGISTYAFSTVIGGGSFGGAPATTVVGYPGNSNGNSVNIQVNNTTMLSNCDIALIAPTQSGGTCIMGQITSIDGSSGQLGFNSGSVCGTPVNPNQIFNISTGVSGTAPTLSGANLYDLGNQNFLFEKFEIMESPQGSTPTLYMTQYGGEQTNTPAPQALAIGVVDIQMQYGVGSNGSISDWIEPENYTPSSTSQILAVQLAMLIRGTQYLPNTLSPASFNILGKTYTVPVSGGAGCLQGNCQHYEYHLFQTIIPVRNEIWNGG